MIADYLEVNGWRGSQARCLDLARECMHSCIMHAWKTLGLVEVHGGDQHNLRCC